MTSHVPSYFIEIYIVQRDGSYLGSRMIHRDHLDQLRQDLCYYYLNMSEGELAFALRRLAQAEL